MVDFGENCIAVGIFDISVLMSGDIGVELVSKPVSFACRFDDFIYNRPSATFEFVAKGKVPVNVSMSAEQLKFCGQCSARWHLFQLVCDWMY